MSWHSTPFEAMLEKALNRGVAEAASTVPHLASVVASAVNARSHDNLTTLTAAAATALRGATTLKVRALKEAWNISSVTPPQEKSIGGGIKMYCSKADKSATDSGENLNGENFPMAYSKELLARGAELLKRTCNGDLHKKIVSVNLGKVLRVF